MTEQPNTIRREAVTRKSWVDCSLTLGNGKGADIKYCSREGNYGLPGILIGGRLEKQRLAAEAGEAD